MKRLLLIVLSFMLILGLVACVDKVEVDASFEQEELLENEKPKEDVGISVSEIEKSDDVGSQKHEVTENELQDDSVSEETTEENLSKNESVEEIQTTNQKKPVKDDVVEKEPVKSKPEKTKFTVKDIEKKKMYATTSLNVRKGPNTDYSAIGVLSYAQEVIVTGEVNDSHWVRVEFKGQVAYASGKYLTDKKPETSSTNASSYPLTYSDGTCAITIYKEWYKSAYVYAAHIKFTDYDRLKSVKASGGYETASHAANRLGAILCINGDYNANSEGGIVRNKKVYKDKGYCDAAGVYNQSTGIFEYGLNLGGSLTSLVESGRITDTMSFCNSSVYIKDGVLSSNQWGKGRAQRTFMGTNGNAGDIWLCVSDGRYNDGKSEGLTYLECGEYLQAKGCTFAVPLDGGGSSTMVFKGQVLNAAKGNQRAVVDFVYFK